jgi:hypothetical protein
MTQPNLETKDEKIVVSQKKLFLSFFLKKGFNGKNSLVVQMMSRVLAKLQLN